MRCLFLTWLFVAGIAFGAEPEVPPQGKQRYVNDLYGYELTYSPSQFEVLLTGRKGERDGAQLSVVYRDYAALTPRLEIQVHPRVSKEEFFKVLNYAYADFKPEQFVVSQGVLTGTPVIVWQARNAGNVGENLGKILQLDLYREGTVLRFRPPPTLGCGIEALFGTPWWQVIESFGFTNKRAWSILRPGEYYAGEVPSSTANGWLSLS